MARSPAYRVWQLIIVALRSVTLIAWFYIVVAMINSSFREASCATAPRIALSAFLFAEVRPSRTQPRSDLPECSDLWPLLSTERSCSRSTTCASARRCAPCGPSLTCARAPPSDSPSPRSAHPSVAIVPGSRHPQVDRARKNSVAEASTSISTYCSGISPPATRLSAEETVGGRRPLPSAAALRARAARPQGGGRHVARVRAARRAAAVGVVPRGDRGLVPRRAAREHRARRVLAWLPGVSTVTPSHVVQTPTP